MIAARPTNTTIEEAEPPRGVGPAIVAGMIVDPLSPPSRTEGRR